MRRVAFYTRVSTDEQTEGYSIHAQNAALEEYAARHGWEVVARYTDEGESARTDNRPGFQRMVSAARRKPKPFDLILVHKFDRFARNREDSSIYKSLFRKQCDIEVRSVTEHTDGSPSGRLLEGMLEVVAEFYSNNLAQEVLKGQRERARAARALSAAPIGYRIGPDGRYAVDPATAPLVQWLFAEYATGAHGYRSLRQRLETEGAARFGSSVLRYRWTDAFIRRILMNEAYLGTFIWGRRDSSRQRAVRDRSEWVVVESAHPALVDPELFGRVQALRGARHGVRLPAAGSDSLLRGLVRCLDCGARAVHYRYQWRERKSGRRVVKPCFLCGAYSKGNQCYCNRVSMAEVETVVLDCLKQLLSDRVPAAPPGVTPQGGSDPRAEALAVERRLRLLDRKMRRLVDAYAAAAIGLEELRAGRTGIEAERGALQARRAELLTAEAPHAPARVAAEAHARLQSILAGATDRELPVHQRRGALLHVLEAVYISRRQGLIKLIFKL